LPYATSFLKTLGNKQLPHYSRLKDMIRLRGARTRPEIEHDGRIRIVDE
jgi:hypothetical protein